MSVGYSDFIQDYSEFSNQTRYPQSSVEYWIGIAYVLLTQPLYGTSFWDTTPGPFIPTGQTVGRSMQDFGVELFTAHNLALEVQADDAASLNAVPGTVGGSLTGRTVNGLTVVYDTAGSLEKDGGHYNLTTYGRRLLRMIKIVGALPIQVGIGCAPNGGANGPGWSGPPPYIIGSPGSGIY